MKEQAASISVQTLLISLTLLSRQTLGWVMGGRFRKDDKILESPAQEFE